MTGAFGDPLSGTVLLGLLVVGGLYEVHRRWTAPPDAGTIEHVDQLYATGEIDLQEMERRKDVIQDPEATRIRNAVETVSGIGERTSFAVAAEFDTLDELRAATRERLTDVSNIGDQRARAIEREL